MKKPLFIKRKIDTKIQMYLKMPEILAIVGPRQSGKTTYIKDLCLKNKGLFLTFEDIDVLTLFNNDVKTFSEKYIKDFTFICIDEFQYSKNGGKNLKYIYDIFPNKKIIISGSSAIDMTVHAIKFLVGRVIVVDFWPFDLSELAIVFPDYTKQDLIKYYSIYGGYPRVATSESDQERKLVLKNIYNTYFLREVKDILGLVDEYKIQKLLTYIAMSVSSTVNFSKIANSCDFTEREVKKYIEFMNKTFVTYTVRPFYTNKLREIVKQPKLYFYDTGFLSHILNYEIEKGKSLEQVILMENIKKGRELKYWRSKQGEEMDFIIYENTKILMALEAKSSSKNTDSFKTFSNSYKDIKTKIITFSNLSDML